RVMQETGGKLPSETAEGTETDPANIAPLVVYLASEEASQVSGQCFAAYGYTYALVSQPQVVKTIRSEKGWTVDSLAEILPKTFGESLKVPVWHEDGSLDQVGLNLHRTGLPDSAWVELDNHVKYWMVPLQPYGETR